MSFITINRYAPAPPYQQIINAITTKIETGELAPGDRIPPIRELAAELGLSQQPITRAFRILTAEGLITTDGRRGSFVSGGPSSPERQLATAAEKFMDRIGHLGFTEAQIVKAIKQAAAGRGADRG